jgi:hypothetical protein
MKNIAFFFLLFPLFVFSQDDLLDELNEEIIEDKKVISVFKSLKVVNFETTKLVNKKDFYLVISHRFGSVKNGIDDLFGLDQAVTQFKFIYGINEWLNLGLARSSYKKKYGLHAKFRLKYQEKNNFPLSIVGYSLITANTALKDNVYPNINFENRLSYTTQLLISRKINDNLSLLLAPSFVHENLATRSFAEENGSTVFYDEENNQFALGFGGRYKLSKRISLNIDYGLHLNRNENSVYNNPFSIGADIETGGHVFQLHFTNAQAMFEEGFITQAQGDWLNGDFFFGFNLVRVF